MGKVVLTLFAFASLCVSSVARAYGPGRGDGPSTTQAVSAYAQSRPDGPLAKRKASKGRPLSLKGFKVLSPVRDHAAMVGPGWRSVTTTAGELNLYSRDGASVVLENPNHKLTNRQNMLLYAALGRQMRIAQSQGDRATYDATLTLRRHVHWALRGSFWQSRYERLDPADADRASERRRTAKPRRIKVREELY
jgi:hypothetical protein